MALLLTQDDLRPLIEEPPLMDGFFSAIERAILDHQRGAVGDAAFVALPLSERPGSLSLLATSAASGVAIRIYPSSAGPGMADEHVMLLMDGESGQLLAILAGDDLNTLRTAVPAGVGARHLAPPDARVLGILGSGQQARGHLRTIRHGVPSIEGARVWSPDIAYREAFAQDMTEQLEVDVEPVESAERACKDADVIAVAGFVRGGPSVDASWVRRGALLVSMTRTIPPDLVARTYVPSRTRPRLINGRPADAAGSAPTASPPPEGPGPSELADVILRLAPAREREDETLVLELAGTYGWDAPMMSYAHRWAMEHGVGTEFHLTSEQPGLFPAR